jgi:hypothetical protein
MVCSSYDSFVRLGLGDFEYSYFIEVDRTTSGSRAIGSQLERYVGYYASGQEQAEHGVFPRVLWLAPDDRRAEAIGGCIEHLRSGRELFELAVFEAALDAMVPPISGQSEGSEHGNSGAV